MNEQETTQEKTEEKTTGNSNEGNDSKPLGLFDRAVEERKRIEQVLSDLKIENDRYEQLRAKELLSGRAEEPREPEQKEESDSDYAKK